MHLNADFHGGDANVLYSSKDKKRVHHLFVVQVNFFKSMGQIHLGLERVFPKRFKKIGRIIDHCYSTFVIWQTLHLAVLFAKTTLDMLQNGELEEITDALTMTIIYGFACFATCYWLWRSRALMEFIEHMNENYRHHSLAGMTYVNSYQSYATAKKMTIYWLISCLTGVVMWAVAPLLMGTRTLALKCWYPFDPMVSELFAMKNSLKYYFS